MKKDHLFNIRAGLLGDGKKVWPEFRVSYSPHAQIRNFHDFVEKVQVFSNIYDKFVQVIRHLMVVDDFPGVTVLDLNKALIASYDGSSYPVPSEIEIYDNTDHALFVLSMRRANGEF